MTVGRWLVGVVLLALLADRSVAQSGLTDRYIMTPLNLAAGLPHNHVDHIFADSQGFIWISTYGGGAVRYDGYTFTSPRVIMSNRTVSNSCKGFAEDGYKRLWIAYDEGTVVMDLRTMSMVTPSGESTSLDRLLKRETVKVYCDTKGALWHVMRDSIYRYTFDDAGRVRHVSRCRYTGNTPDICIRDVDQNGTVWICIENGLYLLAEVGDKLERKEIAPAMSQLKGAYVTDLLKGSNTVWISTNRGLYGYDRYQKTLRNYRHSSDDHSLSHDYTTALAQTADGILLVGTLRGLNILNEQNGTFERWNASTADHPMPSDFVHCMLVHGHQLWIGTETAGIIQLSPKPLLLRNYTHDQQQNGSLSPHPVNAMYVESDGTLWAGTVEGGLNRRGDDGQFVHWTTQNSALSHNSVSVLEPDSHGQLWIGTWGGGVNVITLKGHHNVRTVGMPAHLAEQIRYIGALAYDQRNDALWIGSNDGIFLYHLATGHVEEPFKTNRFIRGCIGAHIDRQGQLWIGCLSGVCVIDLRAGRGSDGLFRCRQLRYKLDHPQSTVVDKITCFCETADGTLWLGSNGYGLYRRYMDKSGHERFEVLTSDDGLANNSVKGIVEDNQGCLWITTNNGLSVYDPRARTFINYGEREGLLCQHFYWNSAEKGPYGAIYLGSVAGLTEIDGENTDAKSPVNLTFTHLLVDNTEMTATSNGILDADISQATHIRLHESNKSFTISFSSLTYTGEVQGHYAYRLKGFEKDWTVMKPGEHTVRYTSLRSGDYTFEVRYIADGQTDDGETIAIDITVSPYFWKSWWFMLLALIGLAVLFWWFYRQRLEVWRRQEAERLLIPIKKVLDESDTPDLLQMRIQNILDNHERIKQSHHRSLEVDKQQVQQTAQSFMERVTDIMENNYTNSEFGVTEFAESIGMSKSLLTKRMNAETGMSTGQFIRNYRLSIAKEMILKNPANRNIAEIAYQVGFNDPKYFTRCFTNTYGTSPSTYKEGTEKG